jgi:hypothetical protein
VRRLVSKVWLELCRKVNKDKESQGRRQQRLLLMAGMELTQVVLLERSPSRPMPTVEMVRQQQLHLQDNKVKQV